jgi:Ca2+-binding EF-hand superfamily protein
MATPKLSADKLDELREAFEYNDRDSDGRIDQDEFIAMLDELDAGMSNGDMAIGFQDIDTNDDQLIDFDEFVAWWAED